jgi:hypothetical protein
MGLKQLLAEGGKRTLHTAVIDGETLTFHPVRVAAMLQAQSVVAAIARAVVGFFDPNKANYTKRSAFTEQDKETGAIIGSSVEEPISPVHAKERIARQQKSMSAAVEAIMSEENAAKLAVLVIDSLRTDEITAEDLVNGDATVFFQLVKETVLANAPTLSPFIEKAMGKMTDVLSLVEAQDEPAPEEKTE